METKLPIDFKERWITALRSGKYKQGKGRLLGDNDEFCCLGVACDLTNPEISFFGKGTVSEIHFLKEDVKRIGIPDILKGSTDTARSKEYNPIVKKLANMNDDGKTFNEIADWIEENL